MTSRHQSQRSGLNRRPLGDPKKPFRRISRRDSTLGAQGAGVKSPVSAESRAQTVPEPFLATLLTVAALVGQARVA